jgi:hypothetical protein
LVGVFDLDHCTFIQNHYVNSPLPLFLCWLLSLNVGNKIDYGSNEYHTWLDYMWYQECLKSIESTHNLNVLTQSFWILNWWRAWSYKLFEWKWKLFIFTIYVDFNN